MVNQTPAGLFGVGDETPPAATPAAVGGPVRLRRADRDQAVMSYGALDGLLDEDHQARVVWAYVRGLDLGPLHATFKAVEGHVGRTPADPAILMALWLYATLDGVGSARALARRCEESHPYRWICGGVSMNYHSLSDFRTEHSAFLDQLLTDGVAALMHEGLVTLQQVAQDGVRTRASAGAASFRRSATLGECLADAQAQVDELRKELEGDPSQANRRQQAARERAARERMERVRQAQGQQRMLEHQRKQAKEQEEREKKEQEKRQGAAGTTASDSASDANPAPEANAASVPSPASDATDSQDGGSESESESGSGKKKAKKPREPRASTTDPDATVMKMPDGGFRPAFNVQFATDADSLVITGVDVGNVGSDKGQLLPMAEQHQERYEQAPRQMLVDGGFTKKSDVQALSEMGVEVYAPVPEPKNPNRDRYERRADDSDAVAAWRERMSTEEAKAVYKRRAATAECVNAQARNRGMRQFLVRGLEKVKAVALWFALAHNLVRAATLRAQRAAAAS